MVAGIRFDPDSPAYTMEHLKQAFDPSFQRKIEAAEARGAKSIDVEKMALDADAYVLFGVSKQRGQAALESIGLKTVADVIKADHPESTFAKLPADIRQSCERAWKQAQESVIFY